MFKDFKIRSIVGQRDVGFPIRLEAFTSHRAFSSVSSLYNAFIFLHIRRVTYQPREPFVNIVVLNFYER
ncbi:hypothetical protein L1987_63129 [Smallanthus sonchifolius]|uniref:Uncharacterized protein n=1 Tax=Smallanthus sonchifolius TaxID=185202 RepID=A0ACB9CCD9_9ASTR|nr:hypothetical protein L1987_63129 [Smallanthus sonchifolius]